MSDQNPTQDELNRVFGEPTQDEEVVSNTTEKTEQEQMEITLDKISGRIKNWADRYERKFKIFQSEFSKIANQQKIRHEIAEKFVGRQDIFFDLGLRPMTEKEIEQMIEVVLGEHCSLFHIREIKNKIERMKPNDKPSKNLKTQIIKAQKLLKSELPKTDYLVDPIIPKNSYTLLFGKTGIGKTWIVLEIARCLAFGEKLFNTFNATQSKVLYCDEENNLNELKRRWGLLLCPHSDYTLDFLSMSGLKIDDEQDKRELLVIAKKYNLIIFDSLREFSNKDENTSQEAQEIIDVFKEINRNGSSVLVIHHPRKESQFASGDLVQMIRGSGRFADGASSLIGIKGKTAGGSVNEFEIFHLKSRTSPATPPIRVDMVQECPTIIKFKYVGLADTEETKIMRAEEFIVEFLEHNDLQECYQAEIKKNGKLKDISTRTIERAIKKMREKQDILMVSPQEKKENGIKGQNSYYKINDQK